MIRCLSRPDREQGCRRAAIYARVSTPGQSPGLQLDELRRLCEFRDWEIVQEYVDIGVSGSKASRPELDALLTAARRGRFDIVVVWKLDRLARSVRHLIDLTEEFQALGVDFLSATESMDTTTPHGRMIFHILAAVGEFERDLIRERIRAGMRAAKARGVKMGRPCLEPTETEKQELLDLHAQGFSIRKIAGIVSWFPSNDGAARHPSPSLVHRILKELKVSAARAANGKPEEEAR